MSVLFALGSNGSGQLGIGHKEDVSVPKQVLFDADADADNEDNSSDPPSPVRRIVAGGNHTLVLCADGSLFWSGDSSSGACGRVLPEQQAGDPCFRRLVNEVVTGTGTGAGTGTEPFRVELVAATWEASVIVAAESADSRSAGVFSFGLGTKGELGQGDFIVRAPGPALIPDFPPADTKFVDLAACVGHVVAVLSNGEAWGWGNGRKGQLGAPEAVVQAPRRIDGLDFRVARVVCGREFTCLFGDPESGEIAVLGSDKWDVRSGAPDTVAGWLDVGASWGNVYVLKRDGSLLSWGRDDHGQIAPRDLPRISRMAVGSEHALALSADGDVIAWGWGEHGNCGPVNSSSDTKGTRNTIASSKYIPPGSKITGIWAGCATSWISMEMPS